MPDLVDHDAANDLTTSRDVWHDWQIVAMKTVMRSGVAAE